MKTFSLLAAAVMGLALLAPDVDARGCRGGGGRHGCGGGGGGGCMSGCGAPCAMGYQSCTSCTTCNSGYAGYAMPMAGGCATCGQGTAAAAQPVAATSAGGWFSNGQYVAQIPAGYLIPPGWAATQAPTTLNPPAAPRGTTVQGEPPIR